MSSSVSKCSKFDADLKNGEKNQLKVFSFLDNCTWLRSCKFQILQTDYLSSKGNVWTKSRKISNITNKRGFLSHSPSEIQLNLMKVLSWRFQKCLGPSNMLTFEWWNESLLFRLFCTMSFTICIFHNTLGARVNFVSNCLKFDVDSRNWIKY